MTVKLKLKAAGMEASPSQLSLGGKKRRRNQTRINTTVHCQSTEKRLVQGPGAGARLSGYVLPVIGY